MPRYQEFPNALYEYLLHRVPPAQLQVFLTMHYPAVVPHLPGHATVPAAQFVFDAVRSLQQFGYVDGALFLKLYKIRADDPDVRTVAVAVLGEDPCVGANRAFDSAGASRLQGRPVLLVLMACPEDQQELDLGREATLITDMLAPVRERLQVVFGWSVGAAETLDLLTDHKPTWLHFAGHGGRDGTLLLVGAERTTHRVRYDALARFFGVLRTPPRCVVLNNCFSGVATAPLTAHVDAVIGMRREMPDAAALAFSRRLYRELGRGRDLEEAFDLARAGLGTLEPPAHEIPQLSPRAGTDPRELRMT